MRVIIAGLVLFACLLGAVILMDGCLEQAGKVGIIAANVGFAVLFLLLYLAVPRILERSWAQSIQEMEERGVLISEYYRAVRALEVEEFDDEGPHYFIGVTQLRLCCNESHTGL